VTQTIHARSAGGDVLVVAAAAIVGSCGYSTINHSLNLVAVSVGSLAILLSVISLELRAPHRVTVGVALAFLVFVQLRRGPIHNVVRTDLLPVAIALSAAATIVLIISLLPLAARYRSWAIWACAALMTIAVFCVIDGDPAIDVWVIFQQSSAGLLHGVNPYETTFVGVPAGETSDCFNYLPMTFLTTWTSWVITGESRISEAIVLVAGWAALGWVLIRRTDRGERRQQALSLLAFAIVLVGTLRVAQQAWNESIVLGFLLIAAALMTMGRSGWAVLAFGCALATKQHVALLLPLFAIWTMDDGSSRERSSDNGSSRERSSDNGSSAFGWRRTLYACAVAAAISAPWIVWNPRRFKACTIDFFTSAPARSSSISLWKLAPGGHGQTVLAVLSLAIGLTAAIKFGRRTVGGLLISSGLTLCSFDLMNKQSFQNQWWMAAELVICGLALHLVSIPVAEPAEETPEHAALDR
jgi:hypothetical protein